TDNRSPMISGVYSSPRGSITTTPFGTRIAARGMSAVTATSPLAAWSAMYWSAISAPPSTRTVDRNRYPSGKVRRWFATSTVSSGLEDVVAATTRLSHVDGEAGELIIAGFPVGELAAHATFEQTTWLLWHGGLPTPAELASFRSDLAAHRTLPPATLALLRECARGRLDHMDALRMGLDTLSLVSSEAAT